MQISKRQTGTSVMLMVFLLLVLATPASAKKKSRLQDATRHSSDAAKVFTEIMNVREKAIPKELLDKAEAIAVFPDVVKAAFIFGGKGGQGVISKRTPKGWTAPAFFNISGGSFGAQIGATKTDYVLLIMNEAGLKGLLGDKFEMGGEVGVAAGPVGREAAASTNLRLDAGILSYSRSKGAFIGAALKGAVISPDNDLNEAVYEMKAKEVLTNESMTLSQMPAGVRVFPRTLARYSLR
jgi:lipid-binding SYLF domain-containing protein